MKALVFCILFCRAIFAQDSFVQNQAWCAKKAEANLKATKEKAPEIAKTIISYLYEYSPRHHACVAVMEYKVQKDGKPFAQILARNMITSQPMKGLDEIYLLPMDEKQERIDAINFLFGEYSK